MCSPNTCMRQLYSTPGSFPVTIDSRQKGMAGNNDYDESRRDSVLPPDWREGKFPDLSKFMQQQGSDTVEEPAYQLASTARLQPGHIIHIKDQGRCYECGETRIHGRVMVVLRTSPWTFTCLTMCLHLSPIDSAEDHWSVHAAPAIRPPPQVPAPTREPALANSGARRRYSDKDHKNKYKGADWESEKDRKERERREEEERQREQVEKRRKARDIALQTRQLKVKLRQYSPNGVASFIPKSGITINILEPWNIETNVSVAILGKVEPYSLQELVDVHCLLYLDALGGQW